MKKTQIIELIKNIKKTMVSFVSIIFFVMLGTGLFIGFSWVTTAFTKTIDKTLNDSNVYDFEIMYPYGLDDDAIKSLLKVEGIEKAEGVYTTESFFKYDGQNYQAKIISLTKDINNFTKLEGTVPSKKGEIAVEKYFADTHDINVGDVIVFKHDEKSVIGVSDFLKEDIDLLQNKKLDDDGMNYLNSDSFVVTGLVETGTYINQYRVTYGVSSSTGMPNDCIMYTPKTSFDKDAYSGYSEIFALCPPIHRDIYISNEYKNNYDVLCDAIKGALGKYCDNKLLSLNNSVSNIKESVLKDYKDGLNEYEDGLKKIGDGGNQILNGKKELENGKKTLEDSQKEIDAGWAEVNSGKVLLEKSENDLINITYAYNSAYGFLDTYIYVSNNKEKIIKSLKDISESLNNISFKEDLEENLPNDIYVLKIIDTYCHSIIDDTNDAEFASDYTKMLNEISENENFISFLSIIDTYTNYSQSIDELFKNQIDTVIESLNSLFDAPDDILYLSNNTFELYKRLLHVDPNTIYNNEKINEIDKKLKEAGIDISIKELSIKIIDDIVYNRKTFDELFDAFSKQMEIISKLGDKCKDIIKILDDNKSLIDDAYKKLNDGKKELENAIAKLKDGQTKIDEGWTQYYENVKLLEDKEKELLKGKIELADAKEKLDKAKKDIDEFIDELPVFESYDISILGRNTNASIASTNVSNTIMGNIKYTMALLFIIVGAFVCYSAISRAVNEQTVLIGTKKALGFNSFEITSFYIMYSFLATVVGSILGVMVARFVLENVVLVLLAKNYIVGDLVRYFNLKDALLFFVFELSISFGSTFFACNKNLKRKTTELLANQNILLGKKRFFENFGIWKRLPLLAKTIINNCLNDTKRVFATLIGIIGCCSLMVCATVLITNMYDTFDYQMENVTAFDTLIYFDNNKEDAIEKISSVLDKNNIDYATSFNSTYVVKSPTGSYLSDAAFSYEDEKFKKFFHITNDGVPSTNTNGIYITEAYAQYYDMKVGDNFTLINSTGEELYAPIAGIFDFYLLRGQIIIPREYYKTLFGEAPKMNTFVFKRGDITIDELYELLNPIDGFVSAFDYGEEAKGLYNSLTSSILILVVIFFILSVVLALLVLLNLMIMFVNEKKRELIVLMINGFDRSDAKKYIYCDTIVLTVIGIFFGILLGVTVGFATLKTFDSECVTIMRTINIPSYLLCGLATAFLTAITCLIALKKIDNFSLTDINKA